MASESPFSEKPAGNSPPAQFSLATIFIVTTVLAFVLALVFVIPYGLAGPIILVLMLAIPAVLLVCAKYGPDTWTAFCIGALMPTGTCLFGLAFTMLVTLDRHGSFNEGTSSTLIAPDPLGPFGKWLAESAVIGVAWRPIAITSWAVAVVIGILCVNVRRFILRRRSA